MKCFDLHIMLSLEVEGDLNPRTSNSDGEK